MTSQKYVVIDRVAAETIINNRSLQSIEFNAGIEFARLLRDRNSDKSFGSNVNCLSGKNGIYVLSKSSAAPFLVFDVANADVFAQDKESDILSVIQRCCRLAIKLWNDLGLSSSEHPISGTKRFALFPFPYSTHSSYRIVLERGIDKKRSEKRTGGDDIYVFEHGRSGNVKDSTSLGSYRSAMDEYRSVRPRIQEQETAPKSNNLPYSITNLDPNLQYSTSGHSFESWMEHLTSTQKKFVESPIAGAERLTGPAGTGKTLCLVLKCINQLRQSKIARSRSSILFIAHSQATSDAISQLFRDTDGSDNDFDKPDIGPREQSIEICTLQIWCARFLGERQITAEQFLDKDALDSKRLRWLMINEIVGDARQNTLETFKPFLSEGFHAFFRDESIATITDMLQHEIGVVIKGRSEENLDVYKTIQAIENGLPIKSTGDKSFVFELYKRYRDRLGKSAQFDSDDVVLSALAQLQTPIWRRRRGLEGYDGIVIDETHLFNMNELSVFHHLCKDPGRHPIIFSSDVAQSMGDCGLNKQSLDLAIISGVSPDTAVHSTNMSSVFRCSPGITSIAMSITASGASLFTNYFDPMKASHSTFTEAEERLSRKPCLLHVINHEASVEMAFQRASALAKDMNCAKSDILIASFDESLFVALTKYAAANNKPFERLQHRGDMEGIRRAKDRGRFVISLSDYIGGLEFLGAIYLGAERGIIPPTSKFTTKEAEHFMSYQWHNRLYVAVTRAKYRLEFLVDQGNGVTPLLSSAVDQKLLDAFALGQLPDK